MDGRLTPHLRGSRHIFRHLFNASHKTIHEKHIGLRLYHGLQYGEKMMLKYKFTEGYSKIWFQQL